MVPGKLPRGGKAGGGFEAAVNKCGIFMDSEGPDMRG